MRVLLHSKFRPKISFLVEIESQMASEFTQNFGERTVLQCTSVKMIVHTINVQHVRIMGRSEDKILMVIMMLNL